MRDVESQLGALHVSMLELEALLSKRRKEEDRASQARHMPIMHKTSTARLRRGLAPEAHISSCLHPAMTTVLLSMVRRKFML
jgi:hypothetical protein